MKNINIHKTDKWCGIGFRKYRVTDAISWGLIFDWILFLGYIRVWKFHKHKEGDIERHRKGRLRDEENKDIYRK